MSFYGMAPSGPKKVKPWMGILQGAHIQLWLSRDILAVGGPHSDVSSTDAGLVRVFVWGGTQWVQQGQDLDGIAEGDQFGRDVALSADGSILASSGWLHGDRGHVQVYVWNSSQWVQQGQDLGGEFLGDGFGLALDLSSDGNTLAVGALFHDGHTANSNRGHIRVFVWDGFQWVQRGLDLEGESGDNFGSSVALSGDGSTLAGGVRYADGNGDASGHALVFAWNSSHWVQQGQVLEGAAVNDQFYKVVLSADGNSLAVAAPQFTDNGAGYVRAFVRL